MRYGRLTHYCRTLQKSNLNFSCSIFKWDGLDKKHCFFFACGAFYVYIRQLHLPKTYATPHQWTWKWCIETEAIATCTPPSRPLLQIQRHTLMTEQMKIARSRHVPVVIGFSCKSSTTHPIIWQSTPAEVSIVILENITRFSTLHTWRILQNKGDKLLYNSEPEMCLSSPRGFVGDCKLGG